MTMKRLLIISLLISISLGAYAQRTINKDFKPVCDTLDSLIKVRHQINHGQLKIKSIMKRGDVLDFYFTESLGDFPWREGEPEWFRNELRKRFPDSYKSYKVGSIFSKQVKLEQLPTSALHFDGKPASSRFRTEVPAGQHGPVVELGGMSFSKGLSDRTIAVWQSHGRYYDNGTGRWMWQRPCLFQTVEDMFTQSFVLPYLVPMLENAGAYVMLPRERDVQTNEVIADFDVIDEAYGSAYYKEEGKWKDAGAGFAALKPYYTGVENPFRTGSVRVADCVMYGARNKPEAQWRPEIPERGEYAVYISYKSLPESTSAAHYTVHHLGGKTEFIVNQKMGGGTWIYLGTFEFGKGSEGYVTLSGMTPAGYEHENGSVVTADAVRFGGGMGNIARGKKSDEDGPKTSGMSRSAEGARYWMQWAGVDPSIFSQNELKDDYRDDFMSRGDWVEWISRGSSMNPSKEKGLGIPVDLSLGFHSDAGITPNDSIVGTLAIYTLKSEGKTTLPGGESRMSSREYTDLIQSQIVNDLRMEYDSLWNRRCIWDRSYRESRTPSAPAMLLELLSHQNFADMKYGLDPTFRFTVSRAVYKGMLKYLSNRYGVPYAVQPLPVSDMGIQFTSDGKARISWKETEDNLEPTAIAKGFILYTRTDDGGFDTGKTVKAVLGNDGTYSTEVSLQPGHIYSFRVRAYNDGGRSFPSETVSIGMPSDGASDRKVLIVNNFDRVSGPAFIDTPTYAGFDNSLDSGVPHIRDIAYIGEMYQFRRSAEFITNDNPGFGASDSDYAGKIVAGNTFDYPYVHGKAMLKAGYAFYSCSNEAFCSDTTFRSSAWAVDMVCGKQGTTTVGSSRQPKYQVFPIEMQTALKAYTAAGGNVLISGAHIATDVWDEIYPAEVSKEYKEDTQKFVKEVLGYKMVSNYAGRKGSVAKVKSTRMGVKPGKAWKFHTEINPDCYCIETPDGISPVSSKTGSTFMRYTDTELSAGVCFEGNGYRTVALGFPIETLKNTEEIEEIINNTLEFFSK